MMSPSDDSGRSHHPDRPEAGSIPRSLAPEHIGPYRLIEVLGEGGMGVVYRAEQSRPIQRQVALKLIKPGMEARQVVARFEAERQALAVMDHPNIARVYDGGATDRGLPYFVMELVEGVPITDYCDEQRLSVQERLELFMAVCQAVQHAHQKGVIHRDLKPSNVLVTVRDGSPVPKVIDFGIAKAIDQRLSEHTIQTQTGLFVGTPAYMSPEQAEGSGLDIDTRADIYSLGVILYELLAGELPFEPTEIQGLSALYTILEREPPTPSRRFDSLGDRRVSISELRRTDPATLSRKLRGDLSWITMKAMEKERGRRYETASTFQSDIAHYLNDEPVLARAPSATYRLGKFVKRHKAGVAAATALSVAILTSAVIIAYLAIEANRARGEADRRRAQAEDLIAFMVGDLSQKLQPIGRLEILDDVADKALEYFAAVPEQELSDEELFRRSQSLNQLGQVRMGQGNLDAALEAFEQSLALASALGNRDPDNGEWQVGLGASHFYVGYAYWLRGELDPAMQQFEAYLDIAQRLVQKDPDNSEWQLELGYANSNIGSLRESRGDLRGALESFEQAMSIKEGLVERAPDDLDRQLDLARSYNTVAVILQKLGEIEPALERFRADFEIRERVARSDSTNTTWTEALTTSHYFLADAHEMLGNLDSAVYHYRITVRMYEGLSNHDPTNADWTERLASARVDYGAALLASGRIDAATDEVSAARAAYRDLLAQDTARAEWRRGLASAQHVSALLLLANGQPVSAARAADAAVTDLTNIVAEQPDDRLARQALAETLIDLGRIRQRLESDEEARADWVRALETVEAATGTQETRLRAARARALLYLGRVEDARPVIESLARGGYGKVDLIDLARQRRVLR
ncbi:MAG: protein kinase [Gemmatimonadales bacterium]|jgi:serine/threonine-protein kinase